MIGRELLDFLQTFNKFLESYPAWDPRCEPEWYPQLSDFLSETSICLISAAPDLLEACKVALDALGCDRTLQDRLEAQQIIHTAVKKAQC